MKRGISVAAGEFLGQFVNGKESRALMYHSVGGETIFDELGIFDITQQNFEAHIKAINNKNEFTFGDLASIDVALKGFETLYLTFDDGYLDNFLNALPILERHCIPATIFVTCRFIECGDPRFLSMDDLRTFSKHPLITIGSHGFDHLRLAQCDEKSLSREVVDSKSFLEDVISQPVQYFSYPNGSFNNHVKQAVYNGGYKCAFTSKMGPLREKVDRFELSRVSVLGIDTSRTLQRKISGAWDWQGRFFMRNEDNA